jgi:hypothetical protein
MKNQSIKAILVKGFVLQVKGFVLQVKGFVLQVKGFVLQVKGFVQRQKKRGNTLYLSGLSKIGERICAT